MCINNTVVRCHYRCVWTCRAVLRAYLVLYRRAVRPHCRCGRRCWRCKRAACGDTSVTTACSTITDTSFTRNDVVAACVLHRSLQPGFSNVTLLYNMPPKHPAMTNRLSANSAARATDTDPLTLSIANKTTALVCRQTNYSRATFAACNSAI